MLERDNHHTDNTHMMKVQNLGDDELVGGGLSCPTTRLHAQQQTFKIRRSGFGVTIPCSRRTESMPPGRVQGLMHLIVDLPVDPSRFSSKKSVGPWFLLDVISLPVSRRCKEEAEKGLPGRKDAQPHTGPVLS